MKIGRERQDCWPPIFHAKAQLAAWQIQVCEYWPKKEMPSPRPKEPETPTNSSLVLKMYETPAARTTPAAREMAKQSPSKFREGGPCMRVKVSSMERPSP